MHASNAFPYSSSTQSSCITTKVLVIGAGPVGLWAVFMCGMMRLRACLIEGLPALGGQCQALYPDKPIYDVPGLPGVLAQDLVQHLCHQMEPFSPEIHTQTTAGSLTRQDDGRWIVQTSTPQGAGPTILTDTIIICSGGGALQPKRPPLDHLPHYEGRSIWYCVPHNHSFADQNVVIAGGGDSAVDWAIVLAEGGMGGAKQIHMVHRRTTFRAQEHNSDRLQQLIAQGRILLHAPYQLAALEGNTDTGVLTCIHIQDFQGQTRAIPADTLLPFFGLEGNLGALAQWGLTLDHNRIVIDPLTGQTNLPGIYAAGDIATYPHKLRLIVTGFGEVAQLTHHLKGYLFPEQAGTFQHSTSQGIPQELR